MTSSSRAMVVGTARASLDPGLATHQASATDMMSPHGFRGSPYLPANIGWEFNRIQNFSQLMPMFKCIPMDANRCKQMPIEAN